MRSLVRDFTLFMVKVVEVVFVFVCLPQVALVPNIHGTSFSGLVHILVGIAARSIGDTCDGSECGDSCCIVLVEDRNENDDLNIEKNCLRRSARKSYWMSFWNDSRGGAGVVRMEDVKNWEASDVDGGGWMCMCTIKWRLVITKNMAHAHISKVNVVRVAVMETFIVILASCATGGLWCETTRFLRLIVE